MVPEDRTTAAPSRDAIFQLPLSPVSTPRLPRSFLDTWRWRGWALAVLALSVATGAVPLVGVLGYELALWATLVASFAGLDLGGAAARHALATRPATEPTSARWVAQVVATAALATCLPLVSWAGLAAVRGLRLPTCDWGFGLRSFAALPLAGGALAAGMGVALGLVVGRRPVWGTLAPMTLALALLAGAGLRAYAAPPVFSYSPLVGYFPGNLYDELIELGAPLAWARLEALAWVLAALALAAKGLRGARWSVGALWPRRLEELKGLAVAGTAISLGCMLALRSGALGYRPDAEDLERALGGRHETAHFIIFYSPTAEITRDLELIAQEHELRLAQVVRTLGVAPRGKLRSYYFANDDQKARWMGARHVEMAKPWRRELYLSHAPFPHPSLRHEIAHAVAGEFGDRWFHVAARELLGAPVLVNPGLIEGLAVAADWPGTSTGLTPHQAARAMLEQGVRPSLGALFSLRFLAVSSARGYVTAGSFVRHLLDTRGAAKLRQLYASGGDWAAVYGTPLAALEREWLTMLEETPLPADAIEAARERFRQVGVFDRPCPHAVAARRARARRALVAGELGAAARLLRRVCSDSPDEPRFRLELAEVLARGEPAQQAEAEATWSRLAAAERLTSSLRSEALEALAVTAGRRGDWDRALGEVERALALSIDDDRRRQLEAMRFSLRHHGPARTALLGYFFGSSTDRASAREWTERAAQAEPTLGVALYLRGLRRADIGDWDGMTDDLERAMLAGLPSLRFVRNAARRLAVSAFRARDSRRLLAAIAVLERPEVPQVDHLLADDWRDRLRFTSTGALAPPD